MCQQSTSFTNAHTPQYSCHLHKPIQDERLLLSRLTLGQFNPNATPIHILYNPVVLLNGSWNHVSFREGIMIDTFPTLLAQLTSSCSLLMSGCACSLSVPHRELLCFLSSTMDGGTALQQLPFASILVTVWLQYTPVILWRLTETTHYCYFSPCCSQKIQFYLGFFQVNPLKVLVHYTLDQPSHVCCH